MRTEFTTNPISAVVADLVQWPGSCLLFSVRNNAWREFGNFASDTFQSVEANTQEPNGGFCIKAVLNHTSCLPNIGDWLLLLQPRSNEPSLTALVQ